MDEQKKYYYIKLKENFFDSDQMLMLESAPDGIVYSNILLKMYLRSLRNEGKLTVANNIPYSVDMLATVTRQPRAVVKQALEMFVQLGLIEILDNGAIYMTDIQNYIGKSSTEGDRKAEYRRRIAKEKESSKGKEISSIKNKDINKSLELEIICADKAGTNVGQMSQKEKVSYAEFVTMTEEEHKKLLDEYGEQATEEMITILDNYKGQSKKNQNKYDSDYRAILNWVIDRWKEKHRESRPAMKSFKQQEHDDFMSYVEEMAQKGSYVP